MLLENLIFINVARCLRTSSSLGIAISLTVSSLPCTSSSTSVVGLSLMLMFIFPVVQLVLLRGGLMSPLFYLGLLQRSNSLNQSQTFWTINQDTVVPLDGTETSLTIRVITVSSFSTRHLSHDGELNRLTISLEANGREGVITNYQHREYVIVFLPTNHRRAIARVSSNLSTSTSPMQHLRNLDNTELVDTTNLTIHQSTGISIVLNLNECFVTEQVFHRFQFWNQFRTNVHYTSTTKYFGISQFRTSDDSSLSRSTVLSKNLVKTHQVLIRNYRRSRTFTSDGSIGSSSTCIQYSTSSSQQVFLENSFSQLYSTVHQFTRQVFFQLIIRIKVQGLLGKFVEETELMNGTFTRQTSKSYTVNATTVLCQQRQFRS